MSNTTKVLRTLVVLGVVGSIAAVGVFSAFSSQTDNRGNEVAAGTVALSDNDAGLAAYDIQNAKPGDTDERCIRVSYTGSLDATVKLYTPDAISDLGPHVNLQITPGTQAVPAADCAPQQQPEDDGDVEVRVPVQEEQADRPAAPVRQGGGLGGLAQTGFAAADRVRPAGTSGLPRAASRPRSDEEGHGPAVHRPRRAGHVRGPL